MNNTREKNHNWRGGRSRTPHGYILIRLGMGHPMADCRGYAYEHRIVAAQKLGRKLLTSEKVHHIDGNRENNSPENIEVCSGNADHLIKHRRADSNLKLPDENNPTVKCLCECGRTFKKYDGSGRPRRYISGHNNPRRKNAKN